MAVVVGGPTAPAIVTPPPAAPAPATAGPRATGWLVTLLALAGFGLGLWAVLRGPVG